MNFGHTLSDDSPHMLTISLRSINHQIPYIFRALSRAIRITRSTFQSLELVASFATRATNSAVQGSIAVCHSGNRLPFASGIELSRFPQTMNGASVSGTILSARASVDVTISQMTAEELGFELWVIAPGSKRHLFVVYA